MKAAVLLISAALFVGSCTDKSSGPPPPMATGSLYQVGGCLSHPTFKNSEGLDSSFSYEFGDTLKVDFSLVGNCCPDSNRFSLAYEFRGDTIKIAAADTAARVCRCICSYVIHAEFESLALNSYTFVCVRTDDSDRVFYSERISREYTPD